MSKPRGLSPLLFQLFSSLVQHKGKAASPSIVSLETRALRPAPDDRDAWRAYWTARDQPWRTEPEIDEKRQEYLAGQRSIPPDIDHGIYPFKDIKLNRADVEWLLACHREEHGPLDHKIGAHARGLDLRGADLRAVDLSRLPLTQLRGGLASNEWRRCSEEQREAAAIHLEGASLHAADLQWASLRFAHLEGADLRYAHLEGASLRALHLVGNDADSPPTDLRYALFDQETVLEDVLLGNTQCGSALLADVRWSGINLAVVNWEQVKILGDEHQAKQKRHYGKVKDQARRLNEYEQAVRANRQLAITLQSQGLNEVATRFIYRAQVLQRQVFWLQILQRRVRFRQRVRVVGAWLFSWFLFLLAGYGYKPGRSFLAYLLVISGFATAYYFLGHVVGPTLSPLGAFVFSMTSFHGRGFFPGNNISLDDPLTVLAAFEALVGLIIEVTFIATLTQRFFNR